MNSSDTPTLSGKRKREGDDSPMAIETIRIETPDSYRGEDANKTLKPGTSRAILPTKTMDDGLFKNDDSLRSDLLGGTALQSGLSMSHPFITRNNPSLDTFGVVQPSGRQFASESTSALLEGTGEFNAAGAAMARRTQALVAHQQFHAARAAAQIRQQAILLQNPPSASLVPRAHEPLLGAGEGATHSHILARLTAANSALLFPHHGVAMLPATSVPSLQVSRQLVVDRSNLLGTRWALGSQWGAGGVPSPPLSVPNVETKEHPAIDLYMRCDDDLLSDHQILLRKQIEYFEAGPQEVQSITHGRRREIQIGQVGIRCKHCAAVPPRNRSKGSVYYPASLRALYQAAQNMAASHFTSSCEMIGEDLKAQFQALQGAKASAGHGGKKYWSDCAKAVGIVETETCLVFKK